MPVQKFLSTSNAITIECGNTRRWTIKAQNSLSITLNLQIQCAAKPNHPRLLGFIGSSIKNSRWMHREYCNYIKPGAIQFYPAKNVLPIDDQLSFQLAIDRIFSASSSTDQRWLRKPLTV
jgi:hypothetical protein